MRHKGQKVCFRGKWVNMKMEEKNHGVGKWVRCQAHKIKWRMVMKIVESSIKHLAHRATRINIWFLCQMITYMDKSQCHQEVSQVTTTEISDWAPKKNSQNRKREHIINWCFTKQSSIRSKVRQILTTLRWDQEKIYKRSIKRNKWAPQKRKQNKTSSC